MKNLHKRKHYFPGVSSFLCTLFHSVLAFQSLNLVKIPGKSYFKPLTIYSHFREPNFKLNLKSWSLESIMMSSNKLQNGCEDMDAFSTSANSNYEEGEDYLPQMIVFDLDATLWTPELYEMSGSPFTKTFHSSTSSSSKANLKSTSDISSSYYPGDGGIIKDRRGRVIDLFPEARKVLFQLATNERYQTIQLALASRTEYPRWAREVMRLIKITEDKTMYDIFPLRYQQIYPGCKKTHFRTLHTESGNIPYNEMIFFDDWDLNVREVGQLGVIGVYNPHGLTEAKFQEGLNKYKTNAKLRKESDEILEESPLSKSAKRKNAKSNRKRRGKGYEPDYFDP